VHSQSGTFNQHPKSDLQSQCLLQEFDHGTAFRSSPVCVCSTGTVGWHGQPQCTACSSIQCPPLCQRPLAMFAGVAASRFRQCKQDSDRIRSSDLKISRCHTEPYRAAIVSSRVPFPDQTSNTWSLFRSGLYHDLYHTQHRGPCC